MKKNSANFLVCGIFVLTFLFMNTVSLAAEKRWTTSLAGGAAVILAGEAGGGGGTGFSAFDYSDAFDTVGFGFFGRLGYNFSPAFTAGVGSGYLVWGGSKTQGLDFDDMNVIPVYAYGDFNISTLIRGPDVPWKIGLNIGIGAAYRDSVDVNNETFWDSNWVFFFNGGPRTEYIWDNGFSIGLETAVQYIGEPKSKQGRLSQADGLWSFGSHLIFSYRW